MPIIIDAGTHAGWPTLTQEAIVYVSGAPVFVVEAQVKKAAREFLRRSCVWRDRQVALLTTVAAQTSYTFSLPANAELNRVHVAWLDGAEIDVQLPGEEGDSELGDTDANWMVGVEPGGQSLRLTPAPATAAQAVTGTVSYVTSSNASGIPQWIFDEWHHEIACGAASNLLMQVSRPWADPNMAAALRMEFDTGVRDASNRAGPVTRRPLRVTPA